MQRRIFISYLTFMNLAVLLFPSVTESRLVPRKLHNDVSISTRQMDVTTPLTTVPTAKPSTPTATTTTTTTTTTGPVLNPTVSGSPDSPSVMNPANPVTPAATTTTAAGGSWCIASQSASQKALQVALDYACGYGGADCSEIQPGGSCYSPINVRDHASYAFNSFYQKNPIPTSCNFGGTAVTTSTNPSYDTCQYPSTSTSSSVLNTTNSSGSQVFGAGPITPSTSVSTLLTTFFDFHYVLISLISVVVFLF